MSARAHIACGAVYTRAQFERLAGRIDWAGLHDDGAPLELRRCACRSHVTWEGLALLCARCGATLPDGAMRCPQCDRRVEPQ